MYYYVSYIADGNTKRVSDQALITKALETSDIETEDLGLLLSNTEHYMMRALLYRQAEPFLLRGAVGGLRLAEMARRMEQVDKPFQARVHLKRKWFYFIELVYPKRTAKCARVCL